LDWEREKKTMGMSAGTVGRRPGGLGVAQSPLGHRCLNAIDQSADGNHGPRHDSQQQHNQVVPEGLLMLVAVGSKARQVVLQEEFAEEGGVLVLHGNEPGQRDGKVEQHPGPPKRAPENGPLTTQKSEGDQNHDREEGCDRPLGQGSHAGEEIDIEEPKL
jgi:hypothetical protein